MESSPRAIVSEPRQPAGGSPRRDVETCLRSGHSAGWVSRACRSGSGCCCGWSCRGRKRSSGGSEWRRSFSSSPGLELQGETPSTVDVRVRGASGDLSRLSPGDLVAVVDLHGARAGQRLFHLTPGTSARPLRRGGRADQSSHPRAELREVLLAQSAHRPGRRGKPARLRHRQGRIEPPLAGLSAQSSVAGCRGDHRAGGAGRRQEPLKQTVSVGCSIRRCG